MFLLPADRADVVYTETLIPDPNRSRIVFNLCINIRIYMFDPLQIRMFAFYHRPGVCTDCPNSNTRTCTQLRVRIRPVAD